MQTVHPVPKFMIRMFDVCILSATVKLKLSRLFIFEDA